MPLLCSIYLRIFDHVPSMCKLWSLWHTLAHIVSDGLTLLSISLTYYTHALSLSLSSYISSLIIFYLSHFHLGSSSYSLSLSFFPHVVVVFNIPIILHTQTLTQTPPTSSLSHSSNSQPFPAPVFAFAIAWFAWILNTASSNYTLITCVCVPKCLCNLL